MSTTEIEWCDSVWNPTRGCRRVSPGCGGAAGQGGCYAERQAHRFSGKGQPYEGLTVLGKHGPRWTGEARFVPEMLAQPLRWRKPRRIFVDSMSDLFHEDITNEQIASVFGVMAACPLHTFQILTKRSERMCEWFEWVGDAGWAERRCHSEAAKVGVGGMGLPRDNTWPLPNVWLGVSCEDQQRADERIPLLLDCPAVVRWVSAEPLLGPVVINPNMLGCVGHLAETFGNPLIHWVVCGGESGSGARPFDLAWARSLRDQCAEAAVPFFFKQAGAQPVGLDRGALRPKFQRDRKGGDMKEWPEDLRVRQHPETRS